MAEYTRESFAALEASLADAEQKHAKAQKSIGEDTDGDTNVWHDNFAFDEANRQELQWRTRKDHLRRLVNEAVVVDKTEEHTLIQVGSHVVASIDGDEMTYVIAGEMNTKRIADDGSFILSPQSPLGAALMGREAGDSVTYTPPSRSHEEVVATIVRVW